MNSFRGGLRLAGRKEAAASPIQACPLPRQLWIPLVQHAGPPGVLRVQPGDVVRAGDALSCAVEPRAVPVHTPSGGRVIGIERRPIFSGLGPEALHVGLEVDASIAPAPRLPRLDAREVAPNLVRQRLLDAGLAGLGGAGFPTADKLLRPLRTLVINGAECEPYIACDDRLLRERPQQVLIGAIQLAAALRAAQIVVALEDSMVEALAALRHALADLADPTAIELRVLPTVYPQGGERQLLRALFDIDISAGGLPLDHGLLVVNVATAAAAGRALLHGEPLTHRLISVAGPGVALPGVFEVALGTPVADLIAAAGGYTEHAARLLLGGPLMGVALPDDGVALGKLSNSIVVLGPGQLRAPGSSLPCIRCGECAEACPAGLLPQQLLGFASGQQWDRLREHGLHACIECACCDLACPSQLPLTHSFRFAKAELRRRDEEARLAAAAGARFEQREARLRVEAEARAARIAEQPRSRAASDAVQQALARARAKAAGKSGDSPS